MKNLLSLIAAVAITSVASAQLSTVCTVTTPCGSVTINNSSRISTSRSNGVLFIKDSSTGEVLDTIKCDSRSMSLTCSTVSTPSPEEAAPVAPAPVATPAPAPVATPAPASTPAPVSTPRRGFSPSAAIGLGPNAGFGGFAPGVRNAAAADLQ